MVGLPEEVRERTDKLDAVGNTTAAIGKGFAIGSAALTSLALFAAFRATVGDLDVINISKPTVMVEICLLAECFLFLFSALAMGAVERAAAAMIVEVRRQFNEIKGLLDGTGTADYARCVDISTAAAIKEMICQVLAIAAPVGIGFIGGVQKCWEEH